jgi:hypothetical protein
MTPAEVPEKLCLDKHMLKSIIERLQRDSPSAPAVSPSKRAIGATSSPRSPDPCKCV